MVGNNDQGAQNTPVYEQWAFDQGDIPLLDRKHITNSPSHEIGRRKTLPPRPAAVSFWKAIFKYRSLGTPFAAYSKINNTVSADHVSLAEHADRGHKISTRDGNDRLNLLAQTRRAGSGWLPLSLRRPYLASLLACTIASLAVVIALHVYSQIHDGLGDDNGKSALFFGWRYVPTLLAVVYALLCSIVLKDVKRTEPYARLAAANPTGAEPEFTLLQQPMSWWTALASGFSRSKNNGHWSLSMICSAVSMIISSFFILPLSSTLLLATDVVFTRQVEFARYDAQNVHLSFDSNDQIIERSRAISSLLQNVTTSAWVTNDHAVLPMWPMRTSSAPVRAVLAGSAEIWHGPATVFKSELTCSPMRLVARKWSTKFISKSNTTQAYGSFVVKTDSGCAYGASMPKSSTSNLPQFGGALWVPGTNFTFDVSEPNRSFDYDALFEGDPLGLIRYNDTSDCDSDEIILLSTPWVDVTEEQSGVPQNATWSPTFRAVGLSCSTAYYTGTVNIQVDNSAGASDIKIDDAEFLRNRQPMSSNFASPAILRDLSLASDWTGQFFPPYNLFGTRPAVRGPASILSAMYNFSIANAIDDAGLVRFAGSLKQRYLGEVLISALAQVGGQQESRSAGRITTVRSRIVTVKIIALTIEISLGLQIFMLLLLYHASRLQRRPLNLTSDPARTALVGALVANSSVREYVAGLTKYSAAELEQALSGRRFWTSMNTLSSGASADDLKPAKGKDNKGASVLTLKDNKAPAHAERFPWRPTILRRWTLLSLVALLIIVLVLVIVLYAISQRAGLSQAAFLYQARVQILDSHSVVAPYSIMPTLIAVALSLWWGAIETEFRILQPYLVMVRQPVSFKDGVNLNYQSHHHVHAAVAAGRRRHWLLLLVCTGGMLAQILTISMSALWKPEYQHQYSPFQVTRSLEIRTVPVLTRSWASPGSGSGDTASALIVADLYDHLQTNWLYSAMIQMTLNGTQPAWSQDGWSFVPVDLGSLGMTDQSPDASHDVMSASYTGLNVTVTTHALRARLQCKPYGAVADLSNTLVLQDLTNQTTWNVTANPKILSSGYQLDRGMNTTMPVPNVGSESAVFIRNVSTSFFANPALIRCCENITDGVVGDATVGYWSPQYVGAPQVASPFQQTKTSNFTVKWLRGRPVEGFQRVNASRPYTIWQDVPKMAALDCAPIIEKANVTVMVNQKTGRVISYVLLDDPRPDYGAWSHPLLLHRAWNATAWRSGDYYRNVTTSYGSLFVKALLQAADVSRLMGIGSAFIDDWGSETTGDTTFNFRRPGVNMDYMSYSMLSQVGFQHDVFLNESKLYEYANRTFSTFFQHYVSNNVSTEAGSWAFQKIGERLPGDLPPFDTSVVNTTMLQYPPTDIKPAASDSLSTPAQLSRSVRVLRMSPEATWLAISILLWLIITGVWLVIVEKRHFSKLVRGVRTIADVAILVAGSDALLAHIQQEGIDNERAAGLKTRLGWFRDKSGAERWGVELVGDEHGVEWLDSGSDSRSTLLAESRLKSRSRSRSRSRAEARPMDRSMPSSEIRQMPAAEEAFRAYDADISQHPYYRKRTQAPTPLLSRSSRPPTPPPK